MNSDRSTTFAGLIAALGVFLFTWFGIELPPWLGDDTILKIVGGVVSGAIALLGWQSNKSATPAE